MNISKNTTNRYLWIGDFDKDGTPNIDDTYPFDKLRIKQVNKELKLSELYINYEILSDKVKEQQKELLKKLNLKKNKNYRLISPKPKTFYSAVNKQLGRNSYNLNDIGRLSLIVKNRKEAYKLKQELRHKLPKSKNPKINRFSEIDDKYKTGIKDDWSNPNTGIYFDIKFTNEVPPRTIQKQFKLARYPFELQIKTKKMKALSNKYHTDYKKADTEKLRLQRKELRHLYKLGY